MATSPPKIPFCYATCSIDTDPPSPLPAKLSAISAAGFQAIELSFPDLLSFAQQHLDRPKSDDSLATDYDALCEAGKEVRKLCENEKLKILVLQPFANFEGWEKGSAESEDAWSRARGWVRIMEAVGTDMLQVGSTDSPNTTSSTDRLASDLAQLADLLAPHNFRIAYENWCWATHAPTWKSVWEIVQKANRLNIGLCLDTFQTAGSEWADPTTASGLIEGTERDELQLSFGKSLQELKATIPKDKIYFFQISDGYKMQPPLEEKPDENGLRPRGRWSHDFRPLPFEEGYLPVVEVTRAVLGTGFTGWFSAEVFDGKAVREKMGEEGMGGYAKRAMAGMERLVKEASS